MFNVKKLTLKNNDFPDILNDIPQPPNQLHVMGDLSSLMTRPRVAIVGSRKVTAYGRQVTERLSRELAERGVVIVSGLALGVDAIAHQACIHAGGQTIAVLPTSLDEIYPAIHRQLAENILRHKGVLISEYPSGTPSLKKNFIERNRLVSGISDGVLITEAAIKSGTLHTANFALEQGKTVMAVPGNITNPGSEGTNNLLKTGAVLVTELEDILSALQFEIDGQQRQLPLGANEAEQLILELMAAGTTDSAVLLAESNLKPREFNQTLTMLEITGKIRPLGMGQWGIQ